MSADDSGGEAASAPGVSLVVLNWNGADLLENYVPSLLQAARRWPGPAQVLVADNGSSDDSVARLQARFPEVEVLELGHNFGFPGGCNRAIEAARHDRIILLNSDIGVDPDFIAPLLPYLEQPDVFAATPRMFDEDGREVTGSAIALEFPQGSVVQRWAIDDGVDLVDHPCPTLYTSGAAMAFRRSVFLELGGFEELYAPYYWEDTDLGYRAWKRGLRSIYEPASRVYHEGSATMKKGGIDRNYFMRRNLYLFLWTNLTDRPLLRAHLLRLPLVLLGFVRRQVREGNVAWWRALAWELRTLLVALKRVPAVLRRRRIEAHHRRWTDSEVRQRSDALRDEPKLAARRVRY